MGADQDLVAGTQNDRTEGGLHLPLLPAVGPRQHRMGSRFPNSEEITSANTGLQVAQLILTKHQVV